MPHSTAPHLAPIHRRRAIELCPELVNPVSEERHVVFPACTTGNLDGQLGYGKEGRTNVAGQSNGFLVVRESGSADFNVRLVSESPYEAFRRRRHPTGTDYQHTTQANPSRYAQLPPFPHQSMLRMYPDHGTIQRPSILLDHSRNDKHPVLPRDGFHPGHSGSGNRDCGFGVGEKVVPSGGITFANGTAEREALRVAADASRGE